MPDLHGWITQQVDRAEQRASHAHSPKCIGRAAAWTPRGMRRAPDCGCGGPAAALRRCEADRKILNRHRLDPDAIWHEAAMCHGCGTEGEMAYPVTENLNDCPELLDLAHAHGLTEATLATLDRPQEGQRPERPGPSLIPDALVEAFAAGTIRAMTSQIIAANTPSPEVKALGILDPELKKIPGYVPTTDG